MWLWSKPVGYVGCQAGAPTSVWRVTLTSPHYPKQSCTAMQRLPLKVQFKLWKQSALLLWFLRPEYFSQTGHYSNTAAGFSARMSLGVCHSTGFCCTGFFSPCTLQYPSQLAYRVSASWVTSTRAHGNWKKTGTLLLRLFLKKTLEEETDLFYEEVLCSCSLFCHRVTRFLKGAESVGHWYISLQRAASFTRLPYLTKLVSHGSVSPLPSHPLPASASSHLKMCFVTKDSPKELTFSVLLRNKNLCCS